MFRPNRGVSELVALLLLLGVATLSFLSAIYLVPAYFSSYAAMGLEASYGIKLPGIYTDSNLKRVGTNLIVFIYNHGNQVITINYRVTCMTSSGSTVEVGSENGVYIGRGSLFVKVYQNAPQGVCFLVVEEPGLIIYKVVES